MTPSGIKDLIKLDLSGYWNAMASIHTTLRRLKDKGEIEETLNDGGEKAYRLSAAKMAELKRKAIAMLERNRQKQ